MDVPVKGGKVGDKGKIDSDDVAPQKSVVKENSTIISSPIEISEIDIGSKDILVGQVLNTPLSVEERNLVGSYMAVNFEEGMSDKEKSAFLGEILAVNERGTKPDTVKG